MGLKKLVDYYVLGKSLKEIEMNRILDKIYKKIKISDKENMSTNKAADVLAERRLEQMKNIKNAYLGKVNHRMPGQKRRFM